MLNGNQGKAMMLILYIRHLKQDPISDKGDIGDLFQNTLGMSEHDWPHPIKMIESIYSLNTCKKPWGSLNSFQAYWQFVIWGLWAYQGMPGKTRVK